MSFVKIWIHVVFSTKNRESLLTPEIRPTLFSHIREKAKAKSIWIDFINGHNDHVHCLISLGKDQTISRVVQHIKGESSYWLNKQKFFTKAFFWQDDYFAVSIAESQLNRVRNYIKNQDEHHHKRTFSEEVKTFLERYGWYKEKKELG